MFKQEIPIPRMIKAMPDYQARKLIRGAKANPMRHYCPNGMQDDVIVLIHNVAGKETNVPTLLVTYANGTGKCLPLNSPVLMQDGNWRELGKIVPGDRVIGHDYNGTGIASPCNVVATSRAGLKDVYKVRFKDGGEVYTSLDHHFPVKVRSGRDSYVHKRKMEDLIRYKQNYTGGAIKFQSPKTIEYTPNDSALPIDPYLLGVLIGDGSIVACVKFTTISPEILNRVKKIVEDGTYIVKHIDRNDYIITNGIGRRENKYTKELRGLGLFGLKSGFKYIPDIYLKASIQDRIQLLSGLIDTDGSLAEYSSKSRRLAINFVALVKSLGGYATIAEKIINNEFTKGKDKLFYRVYWRMDYDLPLELGYKQKVSKRPIEYSNRFVKDIIYVGKMECGDIQVDHPSHTYISWDHISTGNTTIIAHICANLIYGPQNGWFDYPIFQNFPYPKLIWYNSTPDTIKDKFTPEFEKLINPFDVAKSVSDFKSSKDSKPYVSRYQFHKQGWTLTCKSYEQDPDKFESADVGVCLEENQRVLMADGRWKRIIDINVGDKVISYGDKCPQTAVRRRDLRMPKGQQINTVSNKWVHEKRETLQIKCLNGYTVKCTPDHRFWVYGKQWMEAKDIKPGMFLSRQDIKIDGVKTCGLWQAALLGALIGDGSMRRNRIHFTCYNDILTKQIRDLLPSEYELREVSPGASRPGRKEFYILHDGEGHPLIDWLKSIGIYGHKAGTKFVPDIIFKGTEEIKIEFLKYLYATDGWFTHRAVGFASTSERLSDDVMLLLQSIGVNPARQFRASQKENWSDQWHIIVQKAKEVVRFCNKIKVESKAIAQQKVLDIALGTSNFRHNKGIETLMQRKHRKKIKVISVEPIGISRVVDIQTDPHHNFVVNGLITHNCINDEPARDSIRHAQKSRRRMGCITLEIMTPLYCEPDTFNDIEAADMRVEEGKKRTMWHVKGDVFGACQLRGIRGHLKPDVIDDMISEMDEEEIEARAYGNPQYFSGKIYRIFSRDDHFVDPEEFPVTGPGKFFQVVDPHESRDAAVIWAFKTPPIGKVNPKSRYIIFHEYPDYVGKKYWTIKSQKTTDLEVERWKFFEKNVMKYERATDVTRIMDKYFGWQTRGEKNMAMLYAEAGVKHQWNMIYRPSYSAKGEEGEIIYGHKKVREQLEMLEDGKPGLVIWNTCQHTYNGMSSYIRKHETTKASEDKAAGEGKIVEKYKDFADVVRYLVCDNAKVITDKRPTSEHEKQSMIVHGLKKPPPKPGSGSNMSS